jgi:hypothetical protein
MNSLRFTNILLVMIAILLAATLARRPESVVHAQKASAPFTVKVISDPSMVERGETTSTSQLNDIVGNKEVVAIVPTRNGGMMVVLRDQE